MLIAKVNPYHRVLHFQLLLTLAEYAFQITIITVNVTLNNNGFIFTDNYWGDEHN